jgi:cysteine-rich repeat protein
MGALMGDGRMIREHGQRSSWKLARILAFTHWLLLTFLAGCDTTSSSNSGTSGAGGYSGASGASGSAGSSGNRQGSTVSFPTTNRIVVQFPHNSAGSTSSGGNMSASGGSAGSTGSPVAQCVPDQPSGTDTGVCGDGFRSPTEACDDGNTLPGDGCSPSCEITPQLVSPRVHALGVVARIASGSEHPVGAFGVDRLVSGGERHTSENIVSTTGVKNAAPAEVYQSEHVGDFVYSFNGLTPGATYTLRLHFAEIWFDSVGSRVFNVAVNGAPVLENFDIVSVAGGANKAVVREFRPVASAEGQITVNFVSVVDNAKVSGIELIPPANQAPVLLAPILQVNSGGDAVSSFGADQFFAGGWTYSTSNAINTSGVANAAPAEVYQSERWALDSYTASGLTPGELYTVRLHFAEIYHTSVGSRVFHVAINGGSVLEYFDIFSEVGANRALVRDFSGIATEDGQIVVSFSGAADYPKLSALEILKPAASSNPSLPGRSIGAGRHPLVAGCNAVAVASSERTDDSAALYLSTFKPSGQSLDSVQVAQTHVSTPNPGLAALPGDDFVLAWTDFDDDELGISLRKVVGGVVQGEAVYANEDPAFSQSESDIVFDGKELIVAWTDARDPMNGPDLHYRLFTSDLKPITGDQVLAATSAVEDNVVLAGRNGRWAAAWRAGSQGKETIEVQSGASHWTVGPFLPGAANNRPDLIYLDETHLAVAFTMGTDPDNSGVANVPRLHVAVLDPAAPGVTESFAVAPVQSPASTEPSRGQTDPSLVLASDHLLVAWQSEARPGDHLGSELWSRRVPFIMSGDTLTLDTSHAELPLIQTSAQREGDQGPFRMVATTLWPSGGIATVWDDSSRSSGARAGGPDVVLQVSPDFKEPPDSSVMWVTNWSFFSNRAYGFTPAQYQKPGINTDAPEVVLTAPLPSDESEPVAMAFEPDGDMWLLFCSGKPVPQRLMKFSAAKVAGTGAPAADASIVLPYADYSYRCPSTLAFDAAGNLWIGFVNNHLIRFGAQQLLTSDADQRCVQ